MFCRVVYFFSLKFSLVISREFSLMSLAPHQGSAPGPRWGTGGGDFRPPDPLFRIPFMKILDPPMGGLQTQYLSFSNLHTTSHHKATANAYQPSPHLLPTTEHPRLITTQTGPLLMQHDVV